MEYENGQYNNISNEDYHLSEGYSKSELIQADKSIGHWLEYQKNKPETTEAMIVGSAFHCLVLEPEEFENRYFAMPKFDKRKKDDKAEYERLVEENVGKQELSIDTQSEIFLMAKQILSHPIAKNILTQGVAENSFFADLPGIDLQVKCRADYLRHDGIVVDLKTTRSALYRDFQKDIASFSYHVQAAYYLDIITMVTGKLHKDFIFICIEKDPPYNIAIYKLTDEDINIGRDKYKECLKKISSYMEDQTIWTGYPVEINDITLPAWY